MRNNQTAFFDHAMEQIEIERKKKESNKCGAETDINKCNCVEVEKIHNLPDMGFCTSCGLILNKSDKVKK